MAEHSISPPHLHNDLPTLLAAARANGGLYRVTSHRFNESWEMVGEAQYAATERHALHLINAIARAGLLPEVRFMTLRMEPQPQGQSAWQNVPQGAWQRAN